jgi:hypothetical protein
MSVNVHRPHGFKPQKKVIIMLQFLPGLLITAERSIAYLARLKGYAFLPRNILWLL